MDISLLLRSEDEEENLSEPSAKKTLKWLEEEDARIVELRGNGMK
jgi:hypothetical protein